MTTSSAFDGLATLRAYEAAEREPERKELHRRLLGRCRGARGRQARHSVSDGPACRFPRWAVAGSCKPRVEAG